MIKIIDWKQEGITCPVISCDYCGRQIVREGTVLWSPYTPDDLYYVHKHCDRAFEKKTNDKHFYSRELDEFLSQLNNNFSSEPIPQEDN